MNKRERERLLKLADFLSKLPAKVFDFGIIAKTESCNLSDFKKTAKNFKKANCGTTACAMGWCPTVFPRSFAWVDSSYQDDEYKTVEHKQTGQTDFDGAAEFFGLTDEEAEYLFDPSSYNDRGFDAYYNNGGTKVSKITPKEVAFEIRKFIKAKDKGQKIKGLYYDQYEDDDNNECYY